MYELQKRVGTTWVVVGCFNTEDEAWDYFDTLPVDNCDYIVEIAE